MANIHVNGLGNPRINTGNTTMPKYVGARAEVTRTEDGVRIWLKDYKGETSEIVAEAISDIISNDDGSLTFVLPDGREITTDSLTGPQGERGIQGETGPQGAAFTYDDFTEEQLAALVGPQGETGPQGIQGPQGDPFTYDDFTEEQLEALTGPQGPKGDKGDTGATGPAGTTDYNDLINKPTIPTVPTNVSAFTNDAGYLTLADLPIYNGGVS